MANNINDTMALSSGSPKGSKKKRLRPDPNGNRQQRRDWARLHKKATKS